jgi:hypothetical protein
VGSNIFAVKHSSLFAFLLDPSIGTALAVERIKEIGVIYV